MDAPQRTGEPRWLLLIHQIPPKPAYFRAKVARRLARVGAVPIKNAVYVLPSTEQTREDFQWVAREIAEEIGQSTERTFVVRIKDGTAQQVPVQRGIVQGDLVEVFGAIQAGDVVAKRASEDLRNGMPVQAKPVAAPAASH
jgi:hypothetical protein